MPTTQQESSQITPPTPETETKKRLREDEEENVDQTQQQSDTGDIAPNHTIYIRNINERVKIPELKKQLYNKFSEFGPVLEIIAKRNIKMRGQAFVVFKDIESSTMATKKMNGAEFLDSPIVVQFAKEKSDVIAEIDGTLEENKKKREEKKEREAREGPPAKKQRKAKQAAAAAARAPSMVPETHEPNKILFVQNLPESLEEGTLETIFCRIEGFTEVRLVPGKKGMAFVEYVNEGCAMNALMRLQGFNLDGAHPMSISYAKK